MKEYRNLYSAKQLYLIPYFNTVTKKSGILVFDFLNGNIKDIATEIQIHNLYFDEKLKEFIGINSYGPEYIKFKQFSNQEIKYFKLLDSKYSLSGHVTSSDVDDFYYLTAVVNNSGNSCLLSLNKATDEILHIADLGKSDPPAHDCKIDGRSENLIITNFNKTHFYNLKDKKIRSKDFKLFSADSSLRHFSLDRNDNIVMQSNVIHTGKDYSYKDAEIILDYKNTVYNKKVGSYFSEVKHNELLDFSFNNTGEYFACVHGYSNYISIWNTQSMNPIKMVQIPGYAARVSQNFNQDGFLVFGNSDFYSLSKSDWELRKITIFPNFQSKSTFGHKLLVTI